MKNIPYIITSIYLVLVVLGTIPIFTDRDALSGIFAVILTAPWSSFLGKLFPSANNMVAGLLFVAIGAVINAAILYFVSRWIIGLLSH
jgi:fructose-specific phosphotransferase system IIC component